MTDHEAVRAAVEDLIEVLQLQAKELERLATHIEQQTTPLKPASQIPLVVSELSELHNRVKKLRSPASAGAPAAETQTASEV